MAFLSGSVLNPVKSFSFCFRTKRNDLVTNGGCHTHTTAVGFTAYAVFLRTLLNKCG